MSYLGIRGFDAILKGGIPRRAAVLLLAPEGAERFVLGALWVREGLNRGERVLVVLAGESPDAFLARLGRMGADGEAALASGALAIIDWHSAWSGAPGNAVANGIVRAAKDAASLLAAVEDVAKAEKPGNRRALVDVWSPAARALGDAEAIELIRGLRDRLSKGGVTAVFAADRNLPPPQVAELEAEFHAILDARAVDPGVLEFAVLAVGGVRLTPRYRRVRVREDGAAVLGARPLRTFACPICGARVPLDAAACPSCATPRAEMTAKAAQEGLMDYLEALGRPAEKREEGRVGPPPPPQPRPAGLVNGVRPAPGRVNGVAPTGRTNGLRAPEGRTNGMVNGLRRARAGLTNGLTNGSGFTNGLAGPRARFETQRIRWRVYVVPLVAAVLLAVPFLLPEAPGQPGFAVDGSFAEWSGVPGYAQPAPPNVNPSVALKEYKLVRDDGSIRLYASVHGRWFDDPAGIHALYAFLDTDGDPASGYRVGGLGADLLLVVEGSGDAVTLTSLRGYGDRQDAHNWSGWRSVGSARAASSGSELEAFFALEDPMGPDPAVLLATDDMRGGRTFSAVAFGPTFGAVRARLLELTATVPAALSDGLAVEVEAVGAPATVTAIDVGLSSGSATPRGLPVALGAGESRIVTVQIDASSVAPGTLLTATLRGVATEAGQTPTLEGGPVRVYVGDPPSDKRVDGWFHDWGPELQTDGEDAVDADRDLDKFGANRTGTTLYLYADVKGTVLAGWATPVRRAKSVAGEPSPTPTVIPVRRAGEDVLRAYVDVDANGPDGVAVHGLRGADLLLEVRGVQGQIAKRSAYEWRNGWKPIPAPPAVNDERRLEASLSVPSAGAVRVVFETTGWRGPADVTEVSGTRGVRPDGDGAFRFEGPFTATFEASGRVGFAAGDVAFAWTLPPSPFEGSRTWDVAATPVGVVYRAEGVEVRYTIGQSEVKEEYVLLRPPEAPLSLEFPLELGDRTMVWQEEGSGLRLIGSSGHAFQVGAPFAVDARGVVSPLQYEIDLAASVYRIPVPAEVLDGAYPLAIDPPVTYTLRNDGPSYKKGEQLGYSVAVGDFNGDGYADVLAGAPFNSLADTNVGYAYIYYGPFTGDRTTPDVRFNGTSPVQGRFGFAVAAGKFNGDQYWDALVARLSTPGATAGDVAIYYGSASLSGEITTADVRFVPPSGFQNFGWTVAAGNVDNANFDDVLISEPGRNTNDGAVYLYKSPFSSPVTTANYTLRPSSSAGGQLGRGGIGVGTIDSDAYPDIVVGEPIFSTNTGRLQFYKGSSFLTGSGDRTPNATISAPSAGGAGQFGYAVVVGKVNGDAYADVLVSAYLKFSNNGRAYIYLANADGSGLSSAASPDVTFASQSSAERFGSSLLITDYDDDGTPDVAIGAPLAAGGGTNRGRVYWYRRPLTNQTPTETFTGAQNDERFGQALAGGRFSNDARTILAIGAYLWDKNAANNTDNDGRVVVSNIPEPLVAMAAVALVFIPLARRRTPRSRRPARSPGSIK